MRVPLKLLLFGVGLFYFAEVAFGSAPGRRIRLLRHEIKFGTWPLVEISKLPKRSHRNNGGPLKGFMKHAIQSNAPLYNGLQTAFNQYGQGGPHQAQSYSENKPIVFFSPGKPPNKGYGSQPPPPPEAVKVEGPSLTLPVSNTNTLNNQSPLKSAFSSIIGKAAYTGFFNQNSKYIENNNGNQNQVNISPFKPGPPPPFPNGNRPNSQPQFFRGPPPRGPLFNSYGRLDGRYPVPLSSFNMGPMLGDVASNPRFDMSKVPQTPPVITIGHNLPEGYSMTHGEQQLITLKLPNTRGTRRMDVDDLLEGAGYKYGKDAFSTSSADKYKRRKDDVHLTDKKLPDVGAIYSVNMVLQTPNISAPINGSQSENFQQGMEEMHRIYGNSKQSPLDSQVKLLGKLFTELQRLKSPKVPVDEPVFNALSRKDTEQDDRYSSTKLKTVIKSKIDAPVMAVHIQTYSVPEPDTADADVMESARTFGLQGHKFEFGSTNEIINLMDTAQKADSSRIPLEELGKNRKEINENLLEWIKAYVSLTRKINHEAHAKGESIANKSFKQHQYYMPIPPGEESPKQVAGSIGVAIGETRPMDPKVFSQGASITNAGAVATYRG